MLQPLRILFRFRESDTLKHLKHKVKSTACPYSLWAVVVMKKLGLNLLSTETASTTHLLNYKKGIEAVISSKT
ncbi:hypothetical protein BST97_11305 [Nonlabens spongiae]|uniref:Uncharacterized protein n=1 Tax=Nonlabens spongiae TaxID=331648 RepID=A0A1W6MLZ0_9FLAO|nr:hypothetical protein BST97_11305 [Nonlabens spongiae]